MSNNLQCPYCSGAIQYNPQLAGQRVACPHCSRPFPMPASATPSSAPSPLPAPPRQPPPPPSAATPNSPASAAGFPHIQTEAGTPGHHATTRRTRPGKQQLDTKTLLIAGGIAGGGMLLLVVGGIAFLVLSTLSSDPDGGLTSMLPESVDLSLTTDPQVADDREAMQRELEQRFAGKNPTVTEWSDPQTQTYVVVFKAHPPVTGTVKRHIPSRDDVPRIKRELEQESGNTYDVAAVEPTQIHYPFVFEITENGERVVYHGEYFVRWGHTSSSQQGEFEFKMVNRRATLGNTIPRGAISAQNW